MLDSASRDGAGGPAGVTATATRAQAQRHLTRLFAEAGIASASLDARVLLCAALAIDHAALVRDPDRPIGLAAPVLDASVARRLKREPVARILGRREFWGLPFRISPAVLDPRPDTEILVEAVLAMVGARRHAALRLLDLGTGSGAILGALLHELPEAFGVGVDRSRDACLVARDNLRALGLHRRGAIVQASWGDALRGPFDVVVANPPYVARAELAGLAPDVLLYDPLAALDGGADGLDCCRAIVPRLPALLAADGLAAIEGGASQGGAIAAMMRASGLAGVGVRPDLAGHGRVAFGRRSR